MARAECSAALLSMLVREWKLSDKIWRANMDQRTFSKTSTSLQLHYLHLEVPESKRMCASELVCDILFKTSGQLFLYNRVCI